jgi:hypothetical protein
MIGGKRERDTSLSTAAPTRLIRRCDVKLVGSNKPCEDRYSIRARGRDMMQAFAVIDGRTYDPLILRSLSLLSLSQILLKDG